MKENTEVQNDRSLFLKKIELTNLKFDFCLFRKSSLARKSKGIGSSLPSFIPPNGFQPHTLKSCHDDIDIIIPCSQKATVWIPPSIRGQSVGKKDDRHHQRRFGKGGRDSPKCQGCIWNTKCMIGVLSKMVSTVSLADPFISHENPITFLKLF